MGHGHIDNHVDAHFMRRCVQLARNGAAHASPNPMVGAVIVRQGCIIGEGWHKCCGGPHAEVNAVNSVGDKSLLAGSTIYVSLEPCSHYGKTPPCAKLLIECGFGRVVVGCEDPNPAESGSGIATLRGAGISVDVGVCERECRALIHRYEVFQRQKRPYVILKWAQSADGCIGLRHGSSGERTIISNQLTTMFVHKLRSRCSAIMVGTNTALADDPELTVRHWAGTNPVRVAVDLHGRLPRSLRLFNPASLTLHYTRLSSGVPEYWEEQGNVLSIPVPEEGNELRFIISDLYSRGLQTVLVEGGRLLLESFIKAGLWDEAEVETNLGLFLASSEEKVPAPELGAGKILASSMPIAGSRIDIYYPANNNGGENACLQPWIQGVPWPCNCELT